MYNMQTFSTLFYFHRRKKPLPRAAWARRGGGASTLGGRGAEALVLLLWVFYFPTIVSFSVCI